jgi:hypothetical protein
MYSFQIWQQPFGSPIARSKMSEEIHLLVAVVGILHPPTLRKFAQL